MTKIMGGVVLYDEDKKVLHKRFVVNGLNIKDK